MGDGRSSRVHLCDVGSGNERIEIKEAEVVWSRFGAENRTMSRD